MKQNILIAASLACTLSTFAHDFEVDGIYYNKLSEQSVEVTFKGNNADEYSDEYSGIVVLPETVTYKDTIYTVTEIGYDAFKNNTNVTSVTIPTYISSVNPAFEGCISLTSVTWNAKKCTDFYEKTPFRFGNTYNVARQITSFTIGEKVEHLPNYLCFGGMRFAEIKIPQSVQSIGKYAFSSCSNLISVVIPDKVTIINQNTFSFCESLESITLNEKLQKIDEYAFYNCKSLTTITIPDNVTHIGFAAFIECSLSSITIGKSVKQIDTSYGEYLTRTNYTGDIASWCDIHFGMAGYNPLYHSKELYINDIKITEINIPEGVDSIQSFAFVNASKFTKLTIPNSVVFIGESAFENCSGLVGELIIPNNVVAIEESAFAGCSGFIGDLKIPDNITTIHDYTFNKCSGFNGKLILPLNLSTICWGAFQECTNLTGELLLPNTLVTIEENAFRDCSSLSGDLNIPNSVTLLDNYVFYGCCKLERIVGFPSTLTSIPQYTFAHCSNLSSVIIPDNITTIDKGAFEYCSKLSSIIIPKSVTQISEYAFSQSGLIHIEIPDNVISIGKGVFSDSSIKSTTIGTGITKIAQSCFARCKNLEHIVIPDNITEIGNDAFRSCSSLSSIISHATNPPVINSSWTFAQISPQASLSVPCGTLEAYQAASYWCDFMNMTEGVGFLLSLKSEDEAMGSVQITQESTCEDNQAIFEAQPASGYKFVAWNDGNTDNPRTVEIIDDVEYIATFEKSGSTTAINDIAIENISGVQKILENGTIYILRNGEKYTVDGRKVSIM